uniref:interferon-induced very large GTPase 1-like n=1 Tax=Myxine glutinosa TaxID=7769 RepID=UPI00358F87F9
MEPRSLCHLMKEQRLYLQKILKDSINDVIQLTQEQGLIDDSEFEKLSQLSCESPKSRWDHLVNLVTEDEHTCEQFVWNVLSRYRNTIPEYDTRFGKEHSTVSIPDQQHEQQDQANLSAMNESTNRSHNENKFPHEDFFGELGLKVCLLKKLSICDFTAIKMMKDDNPQKLEDLPFYFLNKLLMNNSKARKTTFQKSNQGEGCASSKCVKYADFVSSKEETAEIAVNPQDVIHAVFLCSDPFLQQELLRKMSMCQFALPFVIPEVINQKHVLLLHGFRSITKEWRPHSCDGKGFIEDNMAVRRLPIVSFVRVGQCSLSKSKTINEILTDGNHDIFLHRHIAGGNCPRKISEGTVEVSWYLPRGKKDTDHFPEPFTVMNMRGDVTKQPPSHFQFLTQVSTAMFFFAENITEDVYHVLSSTCSPEKGTHVIHNMVEHGSENTQHFIEQLWNEGKINGECTVLMKPNMNNAGFLDELRAMVKKTLCKSKMSLEQAAEEARTCKICVDEDNEASWSGDRSAQNVLKNINGKTSAMCKKDQLYLQGSFWKKWIKLDKEQSRPKNYQHQNENLSTYIDQLVKEKMKIREDEYTKGLSSLMKAFLEEFKESSHNHLSKAFFLQSMKQGLEVKCRETIHPLREEYKRLYEESQHEKLVELDKTISESSLGLEHLIREMAQMYEAASSRKSTEEFRDLPRLAAQMLLDGYPLEFIDGDVSGIPLLWVKAVLKELSILINPETRFPVVSVLGVQSTGKSTLLNTMFGVQFAVSSGRCTRGAFMQLVRVEGEAKEKLKCDFIMILDTEGLKAPELAYICDSHEHDNELATLVIGLSDVTIINLAMENVAEMKDILQIAVHAFLRMKEVGKKPICHFVHQNTGTVSAHDQNMRDKKHLIDQLNAMTEQAAKMEKKHPTYSKFSDILDYDPNHNNWYIPGLWYGNPPMAPVNPEYSALVLELKQYILDQFVNRKPMTVSELNTWVEDMWKAVKTENFIFNFRNSLVAEAYNELCMKNSQWQWSFKKNIYSFLERAENELNNADMANVDDLFKQQTRKLNEDIEKGKTTMKEELKHYFEKDDCGKNAHLVEKFRKEFEIGMDSLCREVNRSSLQKLEIVVDVRKKHRTTNDIKENYFSKIESEVNGLLEACNFNTNSQGMSEEELKDKFSEMWENTLKNLKGLENQQKTAIKDEMEHKLFRSMPNIKTEDVNLFRKNKCKAGAEFTIQDSHLSFTKWQKIGRCVGDSVPLKKQIFGKTPEAGPLKLHADDIITDCDKHVSSIVKQRKCYSDIYCDELLQRIEDHLERASKMIKFTDTFRVDIAVHILARAAKKFQKMQDDYFHNNNPITILNKQKRIYEKRFLDVYYRRTKSKEFAEELFSSVLKPAMESSMDNRLGPEIVTKMKESFLSNELSSRRYLHLALLLDLKEKHNAQSYYNYSQDYKTYMTNWVEEQVLKFCNSDNNGETNLNIITSNIMEKILGEFRNAVSTAEQKPNTDIKSFLSEVCDSMKDLLVVDRSTFGSYNLCEESVQNFSNDLKLVVEDLESQLIKEFSSCEGDDVKGRLSKLPLQLHKQLIESIGFCGNQCPFCGEPCENGGPGHTEHQCEVHKPKGLNKYRFIDTEELVCEVCTTGVAGNDSFCDHDTNGEFHPYKDYRSVNDYYASWTIPADTTLEGSSYWKWVLCRFNEELAELSKAKPADIPDSWRKITWEDVEKDLEKIYNKKI